jgi:hypothetical protein
MEASQIYVLISIIVLLLIAIFLFFIKKNNKKEKLSPLASIAFAFILAGIIFGGNKLISYSLIGIGVLFAVVDILKKLKKK